MTDRFANGDTVERHRRHRRRPPRERLRPDRQGLLQRRRHRGSALASSTTSRASAPRRSGSPRASRTGPCRAPARTPAPGYHGYWVTDFTQIDPHLGTNAELKAFIDDAHARGHRRLLRHHHEPHRRRHLVPGGHVHLRRPGDEPYTDANGTAFDPAKYAGTDTFPALDAATSFPYTPVIADAEKDVKVPAWLNDPTLYHNRGNSTWAGESVTYGDFDGLDDLMTEHPTVVNGFVDVYDKWIDLGIDGFRIDTAKHVNFEFWQQWSTQVLDYAHAARQARLLHVRRGLRRRPGQARAVRARHRHELGARLHVPVGGAELRDRRQREGAAEPVRGRRPLHDAGHLGHGTADVPRQPRHGPHRLLPAVDRRAARARPARARPAVPQPRPARRLLRRRAGLRRARGGDKDARQTLFASQVAEYQNQPLVTGETAGAGDRYADRRPALRAHRRPVAAARGPPGARDRRADRALRRRTAPASTRSRASTATRRSSTSSRSTTRPRRRPSTSRR